MNETNDQMESFYKTDIIIMHQQKSSHGVDLHLLFALPEVTCDKNHDDDSHLIIAPQMSLVTTMVAMTPISLLLLRCHMGQP